MSITGNNEEGCIYCFMYATAAAIIMTTNRMIWEISEKRVN